MQGVQVQVPVAEVRQPLGPLGQHELRVVGDRFGEDVGKYVVVWRKVGDEWKAAADIFNSDKPAAGG